MPPDQSPRERVKAALEGFSERQRARDKRRERANEFTPVAKARFAGHLNTLAECKAWLDLKGIKYREKKLFGMTIIVAFPGVVLPYRPDGILDYASAYSRRLLRSAPAEQQSLWEDLPTSEDWPDSSSGPQTQVPTP